MVQRCRRFLRDLAPFSFAFHFLSSLFFESVQSKRGSHVIKYRPGLHQVVERPVLVAPVEQEEAREQSVIGSSSLGWRARLSWNLESRFRRARRVTSPR
jgi:hypothetical protein